CRNPDVRPGAVVRRVAVRDDGVEAVVAAGQFEDDENPLGMLLHAGALDRLSGQRGGRAAEKDRQPRGEPDAVQPATEKFTARAVASHSQPPRPRKGGATAGHVGRTPAATL